MIAGASSKPHKPHVQHVLLLVCSTCLLAAISVSIYGQYQTNQQIVRMHAELQHVRALLQEQQATAALATVHRAALNLQQLNSTKEIPHIIYRSQEGLENPCDEANSSQTVHAEETLRAHELGYKNITSVTFEVPLQPQDSQELQHEPGTVCLDMVEMLKLRAYMGGVTWEPKNCYTGLSEIYPSTSEQQVIRNKLVADLQLAAAGARGLQAHDINTTEFWWSSAIGRPPMPRRAILSDPAFLKWQVSLMHVLSRYLVTFVEHFPAVPCPGMPSNMSINAEELPLPGCPGRTDTELINTIGRFAQPYDAIEVIADVVMAPGVCTVPAMDGAANYGDYLMSRIMNPIWKTFKTSTLEEDAVLFLTDILYQLNGVYMEQRWLGVNAMQNPFDFLSISDIIHEVQPDVIIETGTANGGSALMWASMLELSGLYDSSILTIDFVEPGSESAFGADDISHKTDVDPTNDVLKFPRKRQQANPTRNPLWQKYVTFIQGDTLDPEVHTQVVEMLRKKHNQLGGKRHVLAGDGVTNENAHATSEGLQHTSSQEQLRDKDFVQQSTPHATNSQRQRKLLMDNQIWANQAMGVKLKAPTVEQSILPRADGQPLVHANSPIDQGTFDITYLHELLTNVTMATTSTKVERMPPPRPLSILVLLDSNHAAKHVYAEMEAYCTLVSQRSYCVVQDTKMSRWSTSDQGPLAAMQAWIQQHAEFREDRERELFFTNHPRGYLLKIG